MKFSKTALICLAICIAFTSEALKRKLKKQLYFLDGGQKCESPTDCKSAFCDDNDICANPCDPEEGSMACGSESLICQPSHFKPHYYCTERIKFRLDDDEKCVYDDDCKSGVCLGNAIYKSCAIACDSYGHDCEVKIGRKWVLAKCQRSEYKGHKYCARMPHEECMNNMECFHHICKDHKCYYPEEV